jgi:cytochrome c oxidase subunit II
MRFRSQGKLYLRVGLLLGLGLLLAACLPVARGVPAPSLSRTFKSNGEQIYFTATSQRGTPITSDLQMGMMGSGAVACASCHGPDGRGGQVQMMMQTFDAPDIRYRTLTSEGMSHGEGEDHPPYTDETIKRAITQGVDPGGNSLKWPMPRWSMSDADLNDLLDYLKSLP